MAEHIRSLSDTDLRNIKDKDLVREVQNNLGATPLERSLARRLELAIFDKNYVCSHCSLQDK